MPIVIAGVSLDGANEYRQQRFCTSSTVVDIDWCQKWDFDQGILNCFKRGACFVYRSLCNTVCVLLTRGDCVVTYHERRCRVWRLIGITCDSVTGGRQSRTIVKQVGLPLC
jgi:hypothetical protein